MEILDEHKLVPGIYHLIANGEVLYVGQTVNLENRISAHASDTSKEFDSYRFYPCKIEELSNNEAVHIVEFNPKENLAIPRNDIFISTGAARMKIRELANSIVDDIESVYTKNWVYFNRDKSLKVIKKTDLDNLIEKIQDAYLSVVISSKAESAIALHKKEVVR